MNQPLPDTHPNTTPIDPNSPRSFYWLWGLMFGPIIFYWQATEFWTQNASLHWPMVTGTIIECSLSGWGTRYHPYRTHVTYSYEINGTRYDGYQISLWSANLSGNFYYIRRFAYTHPVGSAVTVYYDPKQFGSAVLVPGADGQINVAGMFVGALMVFVAVLSIIDDIRRRRILKAVLNAPDAQTRTIKIRKSDIEKGQRALMLNLLVALGFIAPALGLLLIPLLRGPAMLQEPGPTMPAWLFITGAVPFVLGCLFFGVRAARQSRSADCPYCRNTLNKTDVKNARCSNCGTPIVFQHLPT